MAEVRRALEYRQLHGVVLAAATVTVVEEGAGLVVVDDPVVGVVGAVADVEILGLQVAGAADPLEDFVVEPNLVLADGEVGDLVEASPPDLSVEDEGVLAGPAGQDVLAVEAGEPVGALAALDDVVARVTNDLILSAAARNEIVSSASRGCSRRRRARESRTTRSRQRGRRCRSSREWSCCRREEG